MDISRVSGSRKRTLQFQILTSYAAMPQNCMRRATSDLSAYFGSGSSLNSGSSDSSNSSTTNPCTPKSSESPGFRSLLVEDAQPIQNKNIVLSHQLIVDVANESGLGGQPLGSSVKTKIDPKAPSLDKPLNPSAKISKTPSLVQFGSREITRGGEIGLIFCHDWPCVFAPISEPSAPPSVSPNLIAKPDSLPASEIEGHAIISPDGNPCFRRLTFCTVHKLSGFLRLEEIQKSESYTRVDVRVPCTKVTHMFNNCVLQFPPSHQLIVSKENSEDQEEDNSPPPVKVPGPSSSSNPQPQKFLRNCLYCYRILRKKDIYVYRGDAWFCCKDCRYWNTKARYKKEWRWLKSELKFNRKGGRKLQKTARKALRPPQARTRA